MNWQNFDYTLVQIVHNFGAVVIVGGPLFALWPNGLLAQAQRPLVWLVLIAFVTQAISGAAFGGVSYYWYGQFPDIHGAAIVALLIKIACAVIGGLLTVVHLIRHGRSAPARPEPIFWAILLLLGATALSAAAVLRWLS
jgi:hypothetical protein